jgi:hypothetical protein
MKIWAFGKVNPLSHASVALFFIQPADFCLQSKSQTTSKTFSNPHAKERLKYIVPLTCHFSPPRQGEIYRLN